MSPARVPLVLVAAVTMVAAGSVAVAGQDAHYWTQQFGPRAGLLGGAVIGSTSDFSAAYYNPGGLSLVTDPGFALSTQIFERESITLEDGGGPGIDLGTSRSGLEPSLIAGSLPFGGDRHTWAYALLTRQRVDTDLSKSLVRFGDQIDPELGLEGSVGSIRLENDLRETWVGVTWAYRATPKLGLGVTTFVSWRQQARREEILAQVLDDQGNGAAVIDLSGYDYKVARVLWKAGAQWQATRSLSLGVTVTTPGLNGFGSAQIGANQGEFGLDSGDALSAALKDGADAEYHTPLSVGLGGAYTLGRSRLYGSAEWFDTVDPYAVARFRPTGTGADTLDLSVTHAAKSILNWGIGVEHRFTGKVVGFASIVSDRSAAPEDLASGQNVGTAPWDIHIGSVGMDFAVGAIGLTLGVGIGFGDADFTQALDFLDIQDGLVDSDEFARLRYRSWRFIFGFEL